MLLLMIGFALWAAAPATRAQAPPADPLAAKIEKLVSKALGPAPHPAVVVAVVQDGEVALLTASGSAAITGRPADPRETVMRIGSISKTFTAMAAAKLVDGGALDFDRNVEDYLAGLTLPPANRATTLRDLLHHRSGLEDRTDDILRFDPGRLVSVAEQARRVPPRLYPPGTASEYSNYDFALVGYVVERAAGVPFQAYLQQNFFTPLGMTSTTALQFANRRDDGMPASLQARSALGYERVDGRWVEQPYDFINGLDPAGSVASTAADMTNYMRALLADDTWNGQRLLSPQMSATIRTRGFSDRLEAPDAAFGFWDVTRKGCATREHNGATLNMVSNMVLVPEKKLGIFVSAATTEASELVEQIPDAVIEHAGGCPKPAVEPKWTPASDEWSGFYRPVFAQSNGLKLTGLLTPIAELTRADDGSLRFSFVGETSFWGQVGANKFRRLPRTPHHTQLDVIYILSGDGGPTRISLPGGDLVRAYWPERPELFWGALVALILSAVFVLLVRRGERGAAKTRAARIEAAGAWAAVAVAIVLGGCLAYLFANTDSIVEAPWPPPTLWACSFVVTAFTCVAAPITLVALGTRAINSGGSLWSRLARVLLAISLGVFAWALGEWNLFLWSV